MNAQTITLVPVSLSAPISQVQTLPFWESIRADFEASIHIGMYAKQVIKAVSIQRNLGTKAAAGYLRNQGVPLEIALRVLSTRRTSAH